MTRHYETLPTTMSLTTSSPLAHVPMMTALKRRLVATATGRGKGGILL